MAPPRRPYGKLFRDAAIFLTGVAGFVFELQSKNPNVAVMGLCSLWAGAPAFIPENFLGNVMSQGGPRSQGRPQPYDRDDRPRTRREDDEPEHPRDPR